MLKPMVLQLLASLPRLKLRTVIESSDRLIQSLLEEMIDFFIGDIRVATRHPVTAVARAPGDTSYGDTQENSSCGASRQSLCRPTRRAPGRFRIESPRSTTYIQ
jgi:hypothetical protein